MRDKSSNHVIDAIFPVALLFVFAISSLAVLVLSANIYEHTQDTTESSFDSRTCYSYVLEKARQNDVAGSVKAVTMRNTECLIFKHTPASEDDVAFTTYIYEYDGYLRELQMLEGVSFDAKMGREIAKLDDFKVEQINDAMYKVTFVPVSDDPYDNEPYSLIIGERSAR